MGGGWERDHPPVGRRLAGLALPFLTVVAIAVPLVSTVWAGLEWQPLHWTVLSALALVPFEVLSAGWAAAWRSGRPATVRRRWGSGAVQAGVVGAVVCTILLMFFSGAPLWRSGAVLALQAGTAGTLGALLTLAIAASPRAREQSDVATKVPRGVLAGGLLLLALAFGEVAIGWLKSGRPVGAFWLMGLWLLAGMVVPAVGAFLTLPSWPRRPWVWPAIFSLAIMGLWSANQLLFTFGQMVPPDWQAY